MPDISISSESSAINHCNTIHVQKAFHLCSLCILHHTRYSNKTTARHTLLLHLHSVILLHSAFPNTTQSTKLTTTATIGYMLRPQCQSKNWSQSWRFCTSSELLMLPSLMVSKPFVPVGKTVGPFLGEPDARADHQKSNAKLKICPAVYYCRFHVGKFIHSVCQTHLVFIFLIFWRLPTVSYPWPATGVLDCLGWRGLM